MANSLEYMGLVEYNCNYNKNQDLDKISLTIIYVKDIAEDTNMFSKVKNYRGQEIKRTGNFNNQEQILS